MADSLQASPKEIMIVDLDERDLPVVRLALRRRLKQVTSELAALEISRGRPLVGDERWDLPPQLQRATQEEQAEQVDPWVSLVDHIEYLIRKFTPEIPPTHAGITCLSPEQILTLSDVEAEAVRILQNEGLIGTFDGAYEVMYEFHPDAWKGDAIAVSEFVRKLLALQLLKD